MSLDTSVYTLLCAYTVHWHLFYMLDAKHKTKSENTKRPHCVRHACSTYRYSVLDLKIINPFYNKFSYVTRAKMVQKSKCLGFSTVFIYNEHLFKNDDDAHTAWYGIHGNGTSTYSYQSERSRKRKKKNHIKRTNLLTIDKENWIFPKKFIPTLLVTISGCVCGKSGAINGLGVGVN